MNVFEFVFTSINLIRMPLSRYQGQPLLLVNTASECDYTPQYKDLERLWMDYRQSGLMVVGIPCDDFGHKEPGDEDEIAHFCDTQYQISFPLTAKHSLMGIAAHPLIHTLREEFGDDVTPRWNFYKYLFNRSGQMVDYWPSSVLPEDTSVTHKIECNLQSWVL